MSYYSSRSICNNCNNIASNSWQRVCHEIESIHIWMTLRQIHIIPTNLSQTKLRNYILHSRYDNINLDIHCHYLRELLPFPFIPCSSWREKAASSQSKQCTGFSQAASRLKLSPTAVVNVPLYDTS